MVSIVTEDEVVPGREMTVAIFLRGGDVPEVRFDLMVPEPEWTLVGGEHAWTGTLSAGATVRFDVRVIPQVAEPNPLSGWLSVDGWPDTEWMMAMQPIRFPTLGPAGSSTSEIIQQETYPEEGGSGQARSTITATGRFVYTDDRGNTVGIKGAKVVMYDNDFFFPCVPTFGVCREFMGATYTDDNGFFRVIGAADDLFGDRPDPYVTVSADCYVYNDANGNPVAPAGCPVVVQTAGLLNFTYCFKSNWINNVADQATVDFGEIAPSSNGGCATESDVTGEHGAWQLFNHVRNAWQTMRSLTLANPGPSGTDTGGEIPRIRVFWPDSLPTFYRPGIPLIDDGGITINGNDTWNEAIVFHEYGHHILYHFAESPLPDYNNGTCDAIPFLLFGGHCAWHAEKGAIHWTEGWPDFFAEFLSRDIWRTNDTASSTWGGDVVTNAPGSFESPPHFHPDENFSAVQGYTSAILWDQYDAPNLNEDHDGNGSRDQLQQSFATQWDVIVNFDPDPIAIFHNHPTSIHEFWDGYASRNPQLANRLSEIYDENHISGKPAADLQVTAVSANNTTVAAGNNLTVTDTTANFGGVRSNGGTLTSFSLALDRPIAALEFVGRRLVTELEPAGGSSVGSTTVLIPPSLAPGRYVLRACANQDSPPIFESNRTNNCRDAVARIDIVSGVTVTPGMTLSTTPTATPTLTPRATATDSPTVPPSLGPNIVRILDCVGTPGGTAACAVELALQPGVEVATFQFSATVEPNASAPLLVNNLGFAADQGFPQHTLFQNAGMSAALVGWLSDLTPRVTGNHVVGTLFVPVPAAAQNGATYRLEVREPSATSNGATDVVLRAGPDATLAITNAGFLVCDVLPLGIDRNADADTDDAAEFGDESVNNLDITALFRASLLPSERPPVGSDRFNAMDAMQIDVPPMCGGSATLVNNDVVLCLRRSLVNNVGTARVPEKVHYERFRAGTQCSARAR